ncbi:hypothetical protein [Streptomyces alfalfae]
MKHGSRQVQHSTSKVSASISVVSQSDEALVQSVAADIGPRRPGVVYYDGPRLVQVLAVIRDRTEARRVLRRKAAQFAVIIRDLHTGAEHATCTVWTGSDRVEKAVAA